MRSVSDLQPDVWLHRACLYRNAYADKHAATNFDTDEYDDTGTHRYVYGHAHTDADAHTDKHPDGDEYSHTHGHTDAHWTVRLERPSEPMRAWWREQRD